jgi:hypothetical protein
MTLIGEVADFEVAEVVRILQEEALELRAFDFDALLPIAGLFLLGTFHNDLSCGD